MTYPKKYTLRADSEIREEAKDYLALAEKSPSKTYQKAIQKHVADITMGDKVSVEELRAIHTEIDAAVIAVTDPEIIAADVQEGLLSRETASKARNYPKGEVEKANAPITMGFRCCLILIAFKLLPA